MPEYPPKPSPLVRFVQLVLVLAVLMSAGACQRQSTEWTLGSGPRGGTFENFAASLARITNGSLTGSRLVVQPTGGSVANLIRVQQGELDMGLVFSGDAFLGREGRLERDLAPTTDVLALGRLYGATAHLVVLERSTIRSLEDLKDRRVAIGSTGTGSAQSARRYFQSLGLWNAIIPVHVGYRLAVEDLRHGNLDAVWMQVGFPSEYLLWATRDTRLRFLDLDIEGQPEFRQAFPFYSPVTIPAGTYRRQDRPVHTFQDAALWVANAGVESVFLTRSLQAVFSDQGLTKIHKAHSAAWDTSREKALQGVSIPLHPAAARFWKEQGLPPGAPKGSASAAAMTAGGG